MNIEQNYIPSETSDEEDLSETSINSEHPKICVKTDEVDSLIGDTTIDYDDDSVTELDIFRDISDANIILKGNDKRKASCKKIGRDRKTIGHITGTTKNIFTFRHD